MTEGGGAQRLPFVRRIASAVGITLRADAGRASAVIGLTLLSYVSLVVPAIGAKLVVDGTRTHSAAAVSSGTAVVGIAFLTLAVSLWAGFSLRLGLMERVLFFFESRMMHLAMAVPGLDHLEAPTHRQRLEFLHAERGLLSEATDALIQAIGQALQLVLTLVLLATVAPVLAVLPVLAVPAVLAARRAEARQNEVFERTIEQARTAAHCYELAFSPPAGREVRLFGLGDELLRRHAQSAALLDRARTNARLAALALVQGSWLLFGAGYALAIVWCAHLAVGGRVSVGSVVLVVVLGAQLSYQAREAVSLFGRLLSTARTVDRYQWLSSYAEDTLGREVRRTVAAPARLERGISLRGVAFAYPETDRYVLQDLDIELPAGSTVALVGENGAGKSTLVKLLLGLFQPTAGVIAIDGEPLANIDLADWRSRASGVFQDHARFEFVLRETVGVGWVPDIDDRPAVSSALARARASDLVAVLPDGLETQLGQRFGGTELSGGQWQKVAVARGAMRRQPLLVVLDEPTASLDADAEASVVESYVESAHAAAAATGGITVFVTHRFATVRSADLIVVMVEGRVVEVGSHAELTAAGGLYAELFDLQARGYAF